MQIYEKRTRYTNFRLFIDAVEQRTADAAEILGYLPWAADTVVGGVAVISAGTGVHRGDKLEIAGIFDAVFGTADGDAVVLERLAQHLEGMLVELGQLVGKEHTIVGQAYLAGHGVGAAAHECHLGDGVVRTAEGALGDERRVAAQLAGDGVYLRGLQTLCQREWWHDGRETLGHHRLARAGRPDEYHVVRACRCHFESALHVLLSAHIGKVDVKLVLAFIEFLACVDDGGLKVFQPGDELDDVHDSVHAIDLEVVDHGCLHHVLPWHDEAFELLGTGADGYGQSALDGLQMAVETQLAYHHILVQAVALYASAGSQYADSQRQVEAAAFLAQVGGSEVDGEVGYRKLVAVVLQCGGDTVFALLHRRVAQSGEMIHHTSRYVDFYGDSGDFHAVDGSTIGFDQHNSVIDLSGR